MAYGDQSLNGAANELQATAHENNGVVISTITLPSGAIKYTGPIMFDAHEAGAAGTGSKRVNGNISLPTLREYNSSTDDAESKAAFEAYVKSVANSTFEAGEVTIRMEVCSASTGEPLNIQNGSFSVTFANVKATYGSSANNLNFSGDFVSGGYEAGDQHEALKPLKASIMV